MMNFKLAPLVLLLSHDREHLSPLTSTIHDEPNMGGSSFESRKKIIRRSIKSQPQAENFAFLDTIIAHHYLSRYTKFAMETPFTLQS